MNLSLLDTSIDFSLPKIHLQDNSELTKYMTNLADNLAPYLQPLEEPGSHWSFYVMVSVGITILIIAIALIVVFCVYYQKNKKTISWAQSAASDFVNLPKLLESLPSESLSKVATVAGKLKPSTSAQFRALEKQMADTIQSLQQHNPVGVPYDYSSYGIENMSSFQNKSPSLSASQPALSTSYEKESSKDGFQEGFIPPPVRKSVTFMENQQPKLHHVTTNYPAPPTYTQPQQWYPPVPDAEQV
jgi:hypothetical protein